MTDLGSSPLSRGIHRHEGALHRRRRIIPALAGNTSARHCNNPNMWDHPRSRGEYDCPIKNNTSALGSSPLSRGIHTHFNCHIYLPRIIPALAGNTMGCSGLGVCCRDHPRSRGEYQFVGAGDDCCLGSSPLSRGIPCVQAEQNKVSRIIPALAGNTYLRKCSDLLQTDHPRSRGEYIDICTECTMPFGSSPLSRGILGGQAAAHRGARIIPALAGNTFSNE